MDKKLIKKLTAEPGVKHRVSDFSTVPLSHIDKDKMKRSINKGVSELQSLQNVLYAQNRYSVLIIFQALDAAGKDGTIRHVMSGVNPQGCEVTSFKQPSTEELDHDYLWRISRKLPNRGHIGIFNRSHYEDVLVTRVHPEILLYNQLPGFYKTAQADRKFWVKRYRQINDFERYLTENGTLIIKFFLNVSRPEQLKRFQERLDDPTKNWKFSESDIKEGTFRDEYMKAYSDILSNTSTVHAPWYVIPADDKWYMRYIVCRIIGMHLKKLKLHYPELTPEKRAGLEKAKEMLDGMK
ncbi:MAG: polyphosphate kinase 2 family protein [Culturomica sp.]|jgi:PPK2 family polyphosphate:nucleotide phosphotransferase|nr:polyphosphate kinase 2 family protein [Culturomica sp.]